MKTAALNRANRHTPSRRKDSQALLEYVVKHVKGMVIRSAT
ncbi:unnamed protein product [Rhodiola kirilowii]